jgi:sugar O-acyltransferase (sialic acid O-acetyltransferase NeuD family)
MKTIIFSTSQTSNTILDNLRHNGNIDSLNIFGIVDDDINKKGKEYFGLQVVGAFSDIKKLKDKLNITHFLIGMAALKYMLIKQAVFEYCCKLGLTPVSSIHNLSYISQSAQLGVGQLILPFVSISPDCIIKNNCSIHTGVSILEQCSLEENVMIAGNTFVGGGCHFGKNVYVGPGCTIGSGVHIGENTIIGAGSLVLKNVPSNSFAIGMPISTIKENSYYKELPEWLIAKKK